MSEPPLHVVFSPSAKGSLLQVLAERGRSEAIVYPLDDLSLGEIASDDPSERFAAFVDVIGLEWDDDAAAAVAAYRARVIEAPEVVVYKGSDDATEQCGFLDVVWRRDKPTWVVDVTHLVHDGYPAAFASTPERDLVEVLDRPRLIDEPERAELRAVWRRLRDENAKLRVIDEAGLHSAPVTYFDDMLLTYVTNEWSALVTVVGNAMLDWHRHPQHRHRAPLQHDAFGFERLLAMADDGRIEGQPGPDGWVGRDRIRRRPA